MREYLRFVRDANGNGIGAVRIIENEGKFGLGFSMCNPLDKFNKIQARTLAHARAFDCLNECPYEFYDMIDNYWADDFLSQMPKSAIRENDVDSMFSTVLDIIDDITMDYAKEYYKSL